MGEQSSVDVVAMRVSDGDALRIEGLELEAIYTPGHTDDSYCFRMQDRVFTGDTLLIGGTGRTDLPTGDPEALWDSLFNRLLRLDPALIDCAVRYALRLGSRCVFWISGENATAWMTTSSGAPPESSAYFLNAPARIVRPSAVTSTASIPAAHASRTARLA